MTPIVKRPGASLERYQAARLGSTSRISLSIGTLLVALLPACQPPPATDTILVVDPGALAQEDDGRLFQIDASNGRRAVLSNFSNPAQGLEGIDPFAVADLGSGALVVADPNGGTDARGALFRVDRSTGSRTLLSDLGDPLQGAVGSDPLAVAPEPGGDLLVVDPNAGGAGHGRLLRVDAKSGRRGVLSDLMDPSQGTPIAQPGGIATEAAGTVLLISADRGIEARGALWRVSPKSGTRTLLSDFGNRDQGVPGMDPYAIAVTASGMILVFDPGAGRDARGALFRVDPRSGVRALISDFGDAGQGPKGVAHHLPFSGVAMASTGAILVVDPEAGVDSRGALFRVDPRSGTRELLSDLGRGDRGPLGLDATGVVAAGVSR